MIPQPFVIILGFVIGLCFSTNLSADDKPEISKAQTKIIINNIVRQLNQTYVYPQKAKSASALLMAKLNVGTFGAGLDFHSFRQQVKSILARATGDNSFELTRFSDESTLDLDNLLNAGIASEVLDNNIGYLKITGDLDFPKSINLVEQYFNELCGVDALIIDLRSVDKGSLVLTQKMIGFFVEPGTAVGSVKLNNGFEILKTIETKGFKKFKQNFPLYILNSAFVTGPWELFSFSLQALNKSIVVGELTMGVGFANTSVDVSNNIAIEMTSAIVAGPDPTVTWNDEGVVPNYFTKPKDAVKKAYDLALTQISQ